MCVINALIIEIFNFLKEKLFILECLKDASKGTR